MLGPYANVAKINPKAQLAEADNSVPVRPAGALCCKHACVACFQEDPSLTAKQVAWKKVLDSKVGSEKTEYLYDLLKQMRAREEDPALLPDCIGVS